MLSIFAIPAGLTYTLGRMTKSPRHGWAVWSAMAILFLCGITAAYWAEAAGNPLLKGVDQRVSAAQSGGNMEGKEVRFGIASSALFATVTTDASCGAINSWHDSYTPLGGMVPLVNIMLSETVFGGVGAGLYGILIYVVLAVFIAGLMVGRTPEYLGKKIEAYDVKMAMLVTLVFPFVILGLTAVSSVAGFGTSSITNPGPHGLTQILYAFTSQAGNNGSAFAGLNGNTLWYNTSGAFTMLIGRFFMIVPMLAIAGNLAQKKIVPASAGTFPVTTPLFTMLLVSVIVIVGALTFFPSCLWWRWAALSQPPYCLWGSGILPSIFRSRSGSGSRCCSPTLPKPWQRAVAKLKPRPCVKRNRRPWRSDCAPTAQPKA
jgi:K+-transporting ATPase ATPase A chain